MKTYWKIVIFKILLTMNNDYYYDINTYIIIYTYHNLFLLYINYNILYLIYIK